MCWDKCIGTPGRSLTSREQACLSDCAKRFIESTQVLEAHMGYRCFTIVLLTLEYATLETASVPMGAVVLTSDAGFSVQKEDCLT